MQVFSGEHEQRVDDKGRIVVPLVYRDALKEGVFLTRGMDNCLWLFPKGTWERLSSRLRNGPSFSSRARLVDRWLFAGSETRADGQGRLSLPPALREHAGLREGEGVVIAGVKNRIEVWHPDRWHQALVADDEAFDAAMAELDL
jgi:MraZ protein